MSPPLPPLISALLDPARYPHPATTVDLVETHASWLLLAGGFAYKIKKPLRLPFLDYGTLERRRVCCEAELRLNRRFAPQLYLAVLPIAGEPGDPRIGGTGEATEYAVQMRRLDEITERRQRVASMYMQRLMCSPDLMLPTLLPETVMSWFVFVVRLSATYTRDERDRIIEGMRRHDVGAADYFPCIHLQPFYREMFGFKPGDFPIAESVSARTIAVPFHNRLSEREVDLVCQTLELMISRENLKRS